MMNNKGQTLVIFIIFIPIFLTIAYYLVESGINYNTKNKIDNINKYAISYGLDNIEKENITNELENIIKKNIEPKEINVNIDEGVINIKIVVLSTNIFPKITKQYEIVSNYQGYLQNNKKIITKE